MADTLQFIDERLSNSITALKKPVNPIDRLQPLTFTDWLKHNTQLFTTTNEFLSRYQSYLNNWYEANSAARENRTQGIQDRYNDLINDIIINYSSDDERRYLQHLDVTNSRDLAIAVPFFAKKIKDICLYYCGLREDVQASTLLYNLKGSNVGIEKLLYVSITKFLETQDVAAKLNSTHISLSAISNNLIIDVEDLYDTYTDYYDVSPTLPASAYNVSSGLRNDLFSANQVDLDPYLYLNIDQSIVKAILSYPFFTKEIGSSLRIDPLVNSSQLNLLKDRDYISTVNDGNVSNLNLQNQALELSKYMGVDYYYIATSTTNAYTSGTLFTANSEFANVLNKRYPTIAAIPSQEFLKTAKEVGLFFKPDKIGLSNFTNFKFTASIDITKLQPDSVYYFPDPAKYGNISGNTKLTFQSPITFFEENYFNKIDFSNQYRFGDVATDPYYQTFRAYQAREQTLDHPSFGVSRYIDSQDFFSGDMDTIWSNADAFPLVSVSQFPINSRFKSLLSINKNLFQYKNDVYGNEYGLYKTTINKQFAATPAANKVLDLIFDGFWFNTAAYPDFVDYNTANSHPNYSIYNLSAVYTGVVLRTSFTENVVNYIPIYSRVSIDSQYVVPGRAGHTLNYIIDNGASFSTYDDENGIVIESYDFKRNDVFTTLDLADEYSCVVRDGAFFTRSDNALLPDYSSDDPGYTPISSRLYYNELADGAFNASAPYEVATFTYDPDFTVLPSPNINVVDYDGNAFWDPLLAAEPCGLVQSYTYSYIELSNYIDKRLTNRDTKLDTSLSGINTAKNSLYYTRNVEYGDFYYRNAASTIIGPISSTLSATFINYPQAIQTELYNKVINFDLYFDTLQIETENYLIFDKIEFDYETNQVMGSVRAFDPIQRGSSTPLEKFSTVWFDEQTKILTVCVTTLLNQMSATNYRVIYPTIYTINLTNREVLRAYPTGDINNLTFSELSAFSLYGKNLELNITEIEKPVLNYSKDTGYFTLTYLGKDIANSFYIFTNRFRFVNDTIQDLTTTMHKPATDVYHINFSNTLPDGARIDTPYLDTLTILGSVAGYLDTDDNTFTFGPKK